MPLVAQIAQSIESLAGQIENQSSAVTQSSAAVHQMVANIGAISESVPKAAHAGEAGAGFSVVAEEIRKLAESSASQSKTIARGLKDTIAATNNIAQATATAGGAFDIVATKISDITELVNSINFAMHEQNAGSRQVLAALRDIESGTSQIRDGASVMNAGTETILKKIIRLAGVSQSVRDRSMSITKSLEEINGEVAEIVRNTVENKEAVDSLVSMTEKFRV